MGRVLVAKPAAGRAALRIAVGLDGIPCLPVSGLRWALKTTISNMRLTINNYSSYQFQGLIQGGIPHTIVPPAEATSMLCRTFLWAFVPVLLTAAAALAGEPLFDSQRGHAWDQARDVFYVRRFSTGEVFEHPHASTPPWHEYTPFVSNAAFHEKVVSLLDAVENFPRRKWRSSLQYDAWSCSVT